MAGGPTDSAARRLAAAGCCLLTPLAAAALLGGCDGQQTEQISESAFGAYEVSLATLPDSLAVGWYDTRDGNAEIYLRTVEGDSGERSVEQRLTTDDANSYEIDLAGLGGSLAVAWYDKDTAGRLTARLGLYSLRSGFLWQTVLAPLSRSSRNPVVAVHDGAIFCAWIESDEDGVEHVRAAWWTASGTRLDKPFTLGAASQRTWNLNAVVDESGIAYVVFDAAVGTRAEEIFLVRLRDDEAALLRLSADDGYASKYPDLAMAAGRAALTWFDHRDGNREVYLATGTMEEFEYDLDGHTRRITRTPGESIGAYVAWNEQRIGLAWSDEDRGLAHDVWFQIFDAGGSPLTGIRRITRTPERSLIPAIRPWRDGFAIAWNEVRPGPAGTHDPATTSEVQLAFVR